MTPALLTKADGSVQPRHDQADNSHPLLALTWLDLSSLPLEEGAPTTAEDALTAILLDQWEEHYRAQVDDLQARHSDLETIDPLDDAKRESLRASTRALATGRLDQYEQRLRKFLTTNPTEDELADWLANRATNDAGIWARMDSLDARHQATEDFYALNSQAKVPPKGRKWTIVPEHAAEPKCGAIIGKLYDSYDEAAMALSMAIHKNCPHFVDLA